MTLIAVDTSAVIAILDNEPMAEVCRETLIACERAVISAGTVAECLIVAAGRGVTQYAEALIARFDFEIVPVSGQTARAVGHAYTRWGKGFHSSRLNFGDCFAYVLAMERGCPLLFIGNDFAKTNVRSALSGR